MPHAGDYVCFLSGSQAHTEGLRFGVVVGTSTSLEMCRRRDDKLAALGRPICHVAALLAHCRACGGDPHSQVLVVRPEPVPGQPAVFAVIELPVNERDIEVIDRPRPAPSAN